MNRLKFISVAVILQLGIGAAFAQKAIGFGSGATGGSGTPVVVSDFSSFKSAVGTSGKIVHVSGIINGKDAVATVSSNVTIIGLKNSGLTKMTVQIKNVSNIIIRDIYIYDAKSGTPPCADNEAGGDLFQVESSSDLWFDHCEIANPPPNWANADAEKNCRDGMLDIKKASANITVSYCYFHDHWKGLLIGSSKNENYPNRKVTIHHTYFKNMGSRIPSNRNGVLHYFNNYMKDIQISGVNSRDGALTKIEGNVFETSVDPIVCVDQATDGYWDVMDNIFEGCTWKDGSLDKAEKTTKACSVPYTYTVDKSSDVKKTVMSQAGPTWKLSTPVLPAASFRKTDKSISSAPVTIYNVRGEKVGMHTTTPKANGVYIMKDINGVHPVANVIK